MSNFQSALYRVAETKNFNRILEINTEGKPGVAPLNCAELLRMMNLTDYVKVLEINGRVAGYFIAFLKNSNYDGEEFQYFQKELNSNYLYVDQIAIAEKYLGNGLAKEFYRDAEHFAIQFSISQIVCEVNLEPPNPKSLKFHTSLGFHKVTQLTTQDGREVLLLSKKLD